MPDDTTIAPRPAPVILCVDDDEHLADLVRYALEREGWTVHLAHTGRDALRMLRAESIDLVLLDMSLPDLPGLTVLSKLRTFAEVPVLLLTGRAGEEQILDAYRQGADGYFTKPVSVPVLITRVQALLRRAAPQAKLPPARGPAYRLAGMLFDPEGHTLMGGGMRITLTATECRILHLLVAHAGQVVPTWRIAERVGGQDREVSVDSIKTHIRHLREKMGRLPGQPRPIRTVPGIGYVVSPAAEGGAESAQPGGPALRACGR